MLDNEFNIDKTWEIQLKEEFNKDYFLKLRESLNSEFLNYTIYPKKENVFTAFNFTPFNKVKVVIIGQDPYHNPNQAHGLCFSVPQGEKKPPSLLNIFKELKNDLGIEIRNSGSLETWAKQGVFLLNTILTVRENSPGSHQNIGWEIFTDKVIQTLSENRENIVFLLWGKYAHNKESLIDSSKHLILKAAHPSPFSAHRGFFSCKHFSQVNNYLDQKDLGEIDW